MAQRNAESVNQKVVEYGPYGSQSPTNYRIQIKPEDGERIKEVIIKHGWNVDGIGFLIIRPDSGTIVLEMTGEGGQYTSKIPLKSGETVAGFSGSYGNKDNDGGTCVIATLKIHTNLFPEGYGPYGEQKGVSNVTYFTSPADADFLGIFGRAGLYLESLGALYKRSFFLIRIPKLRHAIGIQLELMNLRPPLLVPVVEIVIPISSNHKPRYPKEDIVWFPYVSSMLPNPLQHQVPFGTLLAPLFCLNYVVHHTPHVVAKQFRVFERFDVARFDWVGHHIVHKSNSGSHVQDFKCHYSKELDLWNKGQLAEGLMQPIITTTYPSGSNSQFVEPTFSELPPSALCQFALDNKLEVGDVCTFELTSTDPMRLKV